MIKKLLQYCNLSYINANLRCVLFLGAFSLFPILGCIYERILVGAVLCILFLIFCIIQITKLLKEKSFIAELSDFLKNNGKKFNGTVVKSEKEINWFGSNMYPFKYVLVVRCEKGIFKTGYFIKDPIKNLSDLTVDIYFG